MRNSFDGDKKKFIENHEALLGLTAKLNNLFKPVVLGQFFISSMLLCALGIQLVLLDSVFIRMMASTFGITVILQLFIYAYGGQMIMDTSLSVANNLYEADIDNVLIIRRSQKPALIEVGFFKANLPAFTSIMNSAGSLITLMKSFLDKN